MFCRTCGEKNSNYANYCLKDGTLLHTDKMSIELVRDDIKFCKECGTPINSFDLYCKNCGISLFKESKKRSFFQSSVISSPKTNKQVIMENTSIRSAIIHGIIAFVIVFIFSLIISSILNSSIQQALAYEFNLPIDIKLFNPLDLSLIFHLSTLKVSAMVGPYGSSAATLTGGLFIFLLIPFSIFFIIGIAQGRKDAQMGGEFNYVKTLLTAVFYGLILSLVSLLARTSSSTQIPYIGGMMAVKKNFSFFTTFINGGLISFLSMLIGYGLYARLGKKESITGKIECLFDGLFIFFIVGLIISIASGIFLKFALERESGNGFMDFVMYCQLGIYALLMINFGSLNYSADIFGNKVSLIKNMDYIKDLFDAKGVIFLYIALLLPIVLFFIYGGKAKKTGNKKIIYTTLSYSIMVGILAYLTHIKLAGTGAVPMLEEFFDSNLNMGFIPIPSFIGSFILSNISLIAGFLLSYKEAEIDE